MKTMILFLFILSFSFWASAQSNSSRQIQVNSSVNQQKQVTSMPKPTYNTSLTTSGNTSHSSVVNSAPNYQKSTPSSNVTTVPTTTGSYRLQTPLINETPVSNGRVTGSNTILNKVLTLDNKPEKIITVRNSNVLFSSLTESGGIVIHKPEIYEDINVKTKSESAGTGNCINAGNKRIPHTRLKCIYGNVADISGPGWYSIHVAAFKDLKFCRKLISYIESRYKLKTYVFDDFSVNMRYHLVMGKYRVYYVADDILRRVRKEMPAAFVINWNRYSRMLLFTN